MPSTTSEGQAASLGQYVTIYLLFPDAMCPTRRKILRLTAQLLITFLCVLIIFRAIMLIHAIAMCRSTPTEDQILVPETLLKKRKTQEKAREERLATDKQRKAVCRQPYSL